MKKHTLHTALVAAAFALALPAANAQVLMLDFGPTTVTGANLTNSPYHTENPLFTGNMWYKAGASEPVADIASGLVWSDGTAATGLAINFGATLNNTTINLADAIGRSNALGGNVNTGVYAGDSVGKDAVWDGAAAGNDAPIGMQISGLAAGIYDIYVTSRNTNAANTVPSLDYTQTLFAAAILLLRRRRA